MRSGCGRVVRDQEKPIQRGVVGGKLKTSGPFEVVGLEGEGLISNPEPRQRVISPNHLDKTMPARHTGRSIV